MIEIDSIQSQVSLSIFDKLVLLHLESNLKHLSTSCKIFNLVMNIFSKLFFILNESYNKTS